MTTAIDTNVIVALCRKATPFSPSMIASIKLHFPTLKL
jgi:hypothetical protein